MRTRRIPCWLLATALTLAAAPAHGGEPAPAAGEQELAAILARPTLDLNDLFRLAELANPQLAVARIDVQAQAGRARQAGLYPNPELGLSVEEWSLDEPEVRKTKIELSQAVLIGGRRGAAAAAARATLAATDQQAQHARRRALSRIHKLWAEQLHFREAEAAFVELEQAADRTLDIARARFEARAAPESHVTRALLEVYELEVGRQALVRERARSTAALSALLGGVVLAPERLTGTLDPDAMEAHLPPDTEAVAGDHPALRAARLDIAAAEAALGTAKKERVPDLNFFVAYGRFGAAEGDFVEGGVSLPLPFFDRNQGKVAEQQAMVVRARHNERIVASELEVGVATARLRHRQAHDQLETITERIAPAAERGLAQAQEAYRTGRLMFLELVDAQRTLTDVRLRTLELRRDLAMSEADLMSLLGAGPYADPGEER